MAKYAFSTIPCDGWSSEEIARICLEHQFSGIELREGDNSVINVQSSRESWLRDAAVIKKAGIQVTNIGSSICVKNLEQGLQQLSSLKRLAEMAEIFGCTGIRVFLGNFARRRDMALEPVDHDGIVEWMKLACDAVADYGADIWIETHNEYATGSVLRRLLDQVDKKNCYVIYDIIHPLEDGEEPKDTIAQLGDSCIHVHLKDGLPYNDPIEHDWKYTSIGEGKVPIDQIVSLLRESGYDGYFSLEWESKWRQELQAMNRELSDVLSSYIRYMEKLK